MINDSFFSTYSTSSKPSLTPDEISAKISQIANGNDQTAKENLNALTNQANEIAYPSYKPYTHNQKILTKFNQFFGTIINLNMPNANFLLKSLNLEKIAQKIQEINSGNNETDYCHCCGECFLDKSKRSG